MKKQRCPTCKSKKFQALSPRHFLCLGCGGEYDDDPDEGGDFYADPSKRMREAEKPQRDRSHLRGGTGR